MQNSSNPSLIKQLMVVFILVWCATLAVSYLWSRMASETKPSNAVQIVRLQETMPTEQPSVISAEIEPARVAVPVVPAHISASPMVKTWVVFAGRDIASDQDDVSLPTGAKFSIKVQTLVNGTVALYTINPKGVSSETALWTSKISARQKLVTPTLRLEGLTGLETLRVRFASDEGDDAIETQVKVWHQKSN